MVSGVFVQIAGFYEETMFLWLLTSFSGELNEINLYVEKTQMKEIH